MGGSDGKIIITLIKQCRETKEDYNNPSAKTNGNAQLDKHKEKWNVSSLKNLVTKEISWLSDWETKEQHNEEQWYGTGLGLAHLRGDDAVVGVTLRDVGLSSRGRFFMPNVHRPTVHPVLLPHTLTKREI